MELKRQTQLSKPERGGQTSDIDSPVFVKDGQSALVNEREGVELVAAESIVGEEDVAPRPQNADCIGEDNSVRPDDVREPEPCAEFSASRSLHI